MYPKLRSLIRDTLLVSSLGVGLKFIVFRVQGIPLMPLSKLTDDAYHLKRRTINKLGSGLMNNSN